MTVLNPTPWPTPTDDLIDRARTGAQAVAGRGLLVTPGLLRRRLTARGWRPLRHHEAGLVTYTHPEMPFVFSLAMTRAARREHLQAHAVWSRLPEDTRAWYLPLLHLSPRGWLVAVPRSEGRITPDDPRYPRLRDAHPNWPNAPFHLIQSRGHLHCTPQVSTQLPA